MPNISVHIDDYLKLDYIKEQIDTGVSIKTKPPDGSIDDVDHFKKRSTTFNPSSQGTYELEYQGDIVNVYVYDFPGSWDTKTGTPTVNQGTIEIPGKDSSSTAQWLVASKQYDKIPTYWEWTHKAEEGNFSYDDNGGVDHFLYGDNSNWLGIDYESNNNTTHFEVVDQGRESDYGTGPEVHDGEEHTIKILRDPSTTPNTYQWFVDDVSQGYIQTEMPDSPTFALSSGNKDQLPSNLGKGSNMPNHSIYVSDIELKFS